MEWILVAQLFGLCGFIFSVTATQQETKNKILLHNGLANFLSGIQYLCLGAYSGCVATFIATGRNIVFAKYKDNVPLYVLIIYLILAIGLNITNITDIISVIPVLNICTYGIAIYQNDIKLLKAIVILNGTLGMFYDISSLAFVGVLNQLVQVISGIIGYIRYKNRQKVYV